VMFNSHHQTLHAIFSTSFSAISPPLSQLSIVGLLKHSMLVNCTTVKHHLLLSSCSYVLSRPSFRTIPEFASNTGAGIGIRCAQDVGAHRKKVHGGKITLQDEQWKRVFWCVELYIIHIVRHVPYILDIGASSCWIGTSAQLLVVLWLAKMRSK
jgi:hypothetical protein